MRLHVFSQATRALKDAFQGWQSSELLDGCLVVWQSNLSFRGMQ